MSKSIIVTFGWTESPVIGAVVRHGLEPGDRIILLKPVNGDERSEKAVNDLKAFIRNISGVELAEEEINVNDFVNAVISIKRILESEGMGRNIIVNLSGGMRILVLATYLAALFTKNARLEIESENKKFRTLLPSIDMAQISRLKSNHIKLLSLLQLFKGVCSVKDLMNASKLSRSTFYACIKNLKKMGLVEEAGKRGLLKITSNGTLLVILLKR
jgi:CRISPR locus-related DNA-binding protein